MGEKMIKKGLFGKIYPFIRKQHSVQCNHLLGSEFQHIHRKMDKKGGWHHRKYGHDHNFIAQFNGKEKQAAYIHLLGDCILDKFDEILRPVLIEINNNAVEPPYYSKPTKSG